MYFCRKVVVMIRKLLITIFLLSQCGIIALAIGITDKQVQQALLTLDEQLELRNDYIKKRQFTIDSLCRLSEDEKSVEYQAFNLMRIGDEYSSFNNDSALVYYSAGKQLAEDTGNDSIVLAFRLKLDTYWPLAGIVATAVNDYEQINPDTIPQGLKVRYYEAGYQMYSYVSSFYLNYPDIERGWRIKSIKSQESLINLLDKSSVEYKLNLGELYFLDKEYSKAKAVLDVLMETLSPSSNLYARATHLYSLIAKAQDNENDRIYYLAQSAIADIKIATLEVMSLQELGELMYQKGDIKRAYRYLAVALDNAVQCNAAMRMLQTAKIIPIIEKAHTAEIEQWRYLIYYIVGGLAILLIVLLVTLFFFRREVLKMRLLQKNLENANNTKEVYISKFLSLCSIYMDKLNQFSRFVNRKISAGQVDDLHKMTKSGKFVEEQNRDFYEVFDDAFLHLYPSFVEKVNELLRPEEKIILGEDEKLNTDLRILAFMRLGIEEGAKVAQILNYSVNTIYAYRNKLKNRAINRDTFDADIMQIPSVE